MRAKIKRNRRLRERAWRGVFRPAVPPIIMGNARSVNNKMEELESLIRSQKVYRESSYVNARLMLKAPINALPCHLSGDQTTVSSISPHLCSCYKKTACHHQNLEVLVP